MKRKFLSCIGDRVEVAVQHRVQSVELVGELGGGCHHGFQLGLVEKRDLAGVGRAPVPPVVARSR
ncbi:hypothetical protein [Mycobacterium sp.]|uniref:hypothetical protein n=1 Tax=Mycobacterium sp. TaxID=1785 RepID=UPI003F9A4BE2